MHFIQLFNRVWVKGRDGEHTIVRIDHPARLVDLCPPPGGTAFVTHVPFNLLSAFPMFTPLNSDFSVADWRATTHEIVMSSSRNMHSSSLAIAELRDQIRATIEIIRATQNRILESDELIARAGFAPREIDRILGP